MAYKQTPGRGNSPKTGNGLPSPLRQEVEPTEKYIKGKKKLAENRAKGATDSGLKVDAATGVATAKNYEKRFVLNTKTGGASIIGGDNKTIATATRHGKEVEKLRSGFTSDSTSTMNRRNRNAEFYNANSGGTKLENLNEKQKKDLKGIRKITS